MDCVSGVEVFATLCARYRAVQARMEEYRLPLKVQCPCGKSEGEREVVVVAFQPSLAAPTRRKRIDEVHNVRLFVRDGGGVAARNIT